MNIITLLKISALKTTISITEKIIVLKILLSLIFGKKNAEPMRYMVTSTIDKKLEGDC